MGLRDFFSWRISRKDSDENEQDGFAWETDLSKASDEELLSEYQRVSICLFTLTPYPTYTAGEMVYFSYLADELGRRGYKLRGIDGEEISETEAKELGIETGKEQRELSDPEIAVRDFCQAILEGDHPRALECCLPTYAREIVDDFTDGPGELEEFEQMQEKQVSDKEINSMKYRCCEVGVETSWDYDGKVTKERLLFELVEVDEKWRIAGV